MKNITFKQKIYIGVMSILVIQWSMILAQPATPTPPPIDIVTVYTPNSTPVRAYSVLGELTAGQMEYVNNDARYSFPEAEFISNSSWKYNCHGYAWHISEGGTHVWIDNPGDDTYWADGSYGKATDPKGAKVSYGSAEDHSAITATQTGQVISKWNYGPLMRHAPQHCPFNDTSDIHYYAPAVPPARPLAMSYGRQDEEFAADIVLTHDGGALLAGQFTVNSSGTGEDFWLLKVDRHGSIPAPDNSTYMGGGWQRRYGGTDNDAAAAVVQAPDYGYVAAGVSYSFSQVMAGLLVKMNADGTQSGCFPDNCWHKVYRDPENRNLIFMDMNLWSSYNNGSYSDGYIIAGRARLPVETSLEARAVDEKTSLFHTLIEVPAGSDLDTLRANGDRLRSTASLETAWVMKVDLNGTPIWQRAYNHTSLAIEKAFTIQQIDKDGNSRTNDGYLVAGSILGTSGGADCLLFTLDENGGLVWQKRYGGAETEEVLAVQQTDDDGDGFQDDGYIVSGYTTSFGSGDIDAWIFKLKADGTVAWQHTYGGPARDIVRTIIQTSDKGYFAAGYTSSFGENTDVWGLKLDHAGNVVWSNRYGGNSSEDGVTAVQEADGSYLVAGWTLSYGAGDRDILLLRIAEEGTSLDCLPGTPVTGQIQVTTPSYSTFPVALEAVATSMTVSAPSLTSSATSIQPGVICESANRHLLWTK